MDTLAYGVDTDRRTETWVGAGTRRHTHGRQRDRREWRGGMGTWTGRQPPQASGQHPECRASPPRGLSVPNSPHRVTREPTAVAFSLYCALPRTHLHQLRKSPRFILERPSALVRKRGGRKAFLRVACWLPSGRRARVIPDGF